MGADDQARRAPYLAADGGPCHPMAGKLDKSREIVRRRLYLQTQRSVALSRGGYVGGSWIEADSSDTIEVIVAATTPWNFANAIITRKAGPVFAAGCALVLKPTEQAPFSAIALLEIRS